MRRLAAHSCLITLTILAGAGALVPGAAQAAKLARPARPAHVAAAKWTKISADTGLGIAINLTRKSRNLGNCQAHVALKFHVHFAHD